MKYSQNGKFPFINGNPTTNYQFDNADHVKSELYAIGVRLGVYPLPHEAYIGEYKNKL